MSQDYKNVSVGIQISEDGQRIWVCIDGTCALRVKGINVLEFTDLRQLLKEEQKRMAVLPESGMSPSVCISCGTTEDLEYGPDPFQLDVNGDDTPVWECGNCRHQSAQDI